MTDVFYPDLGGNGKGVVDLDVDKAKTFPGVTPEMFGAVGNCTAVGKGADDWPAVVAAIAYLRSKGGRRLFLGDRLYRMSKPLPMYEGIDIVGVGWTLNPGVINGTLYPGPLAVRGSVLVFDNNVAGLIYYAHTDTLDTNTVVASLNALGNNSPEWKYPSASHSNLRDVTLYSSGSTLTAHGLEIRTTISVKHVYIRGFGGCGVFVHASADASTPGGAYGNADLTILEDVLSVANQSHGFRLEGRDANVIKVDSCNAQLNGGWGFCDDGELGNKYLNDHAANNNQATGANRTALVAAYPALADPYVGSYYASSAVAAHTYDTCYVENGSGKGARLQQNCAVSDGTLASETFFQPTEEAHVNNAGNATRRGFSGSNTNQGALTFTGSMSGGVLTVTALDDVSLPYLKVGTQITGVGLVSPTTIISLGTGTGGLGTYNINSGQVIASQALSTVVATTGIGRDPSKTPGTSFWFGSNDDAASMDTFRLNYQFNSGGTWALTYANSGAAISLELVNGLAITPKAGLTNAFALGLPNGCTRGPHATAARNLPDAATAPTSGTYRRGDIIKNIAPTVGSPKGWVCTVAGSPGTWISEGNL